MGNFKVCSCKNIWNHCIAIIFECSVVNDFFTILITSKQLILSESAKLRALAPTRLTHN